MTKKYRLGEKHPQMDLWRVVAERDIPRWGVTTGEVGGWVSGEHNLSHDGDAWVFGDARVFGDAQVSDQARVYGQVFGDQVSDQARVYGQVFCSSSQGVRSGVRSSSGLWSSQGVRSGVRSSSGLWSSQGVATLRSV